MSDVYIAMLTGRTAQDIERLRYAYEMHPVTHHVDTCSGEFDALTPYLYTTYGETEEAEPMGGDAVVILASGPNRIGQGLEFDTCCTLASMAYRRLGRKTIMVNSNPETVSTDFNISDRLYLQGLTAEEVKEILRHEQTQRVVVQLGGQTPLNLAPSLTRAGARLEGTSLEGLLDAGDRGKFSALVSQLGLSQPKKTKPSQRMKIFSSPLARLVFLFLSGPAMYWVDGGCTSCTMKQDLPPLRGLRHQLKHLYWWISSWKMPLNTTLMQYLTEKVSM